MKRILVTGSRSWRDAGAIERALAAYQPHLVTIVHGGCPEGADAIAERYATLRGFATEVYPVSREEWRKLGRKAGPLRNARMVATRPDLVLAFWDGKSTGTADTVRRARAAGIPTTVIEP